MALPCGAFFWSNDMKSSYYLVDYKCFGSTAAALSEWLAFVACMAGQDLTYEGW